jgi:hypothetical protein
MPPATVPCVMVSSIASSFSKAKFFAALTEPVVSFRLDIQTGAFFAKICQPKDNLRTN